eukprot:TRINITY_DN61015_c0_g1_i1.p2 TRINITY_DN61015_c0_g1~~TRINITY_DN61015_c0_g1_i1.p2  ORF type:complete len:717 (-),score=90.44 TRINITY_DN61015_c0_g1_i1:2424-4574(-)
MYAGRHSSSDDHSRIMEEMDDFLLSEYKKYQTGTSIQPHLGHKTLTGSMKPAAPPFQGFPTRPPGFSDSNRSVSLKHMHSQLPSPPTKQKLVPIADTVEPSASKLPELKQKHVLDPTPDILKKPLPAHHNTLAPLWDKPKGEPEDAADGKTQTTSLTSPTTSPTAPTPTSNSRKHKQSPGYWINQPPPPPILEKPTEKTKLQPMAVRPQPPPTEPLPMGLTSTPPSNSKLPPLQHSSKPTTPLSLESRQPLVSKPLPPTVSPPTHEKSTSPRSYSAMQHLFTAATRGSAMASQDPVGLNLLQNTVRPEAKPLLVQQQQKSATNSHLQANSINNESGTTFPKSVSTLANVGSFVLVEAEGASNSGEGSLPSYQTTLMTEERREEESTSNLQPAEDHEVMERREEEEEMVQERREEEFGSDPQPTDTPQEQVMERREEDEDSEIQNAEKLLEHHKAKEVPEETLPVPSYFGANSAQVKTDFPRAQKQGGAASGIASIATGGKTLSESKIPSCNMKYPYLGLIATLAEYHQSPASPLNHLSATNSVGNLNCTPDNVITDLVKPHVQPLKREEVSQPKYKYLDGLLPLFKTNSNQLPTLRTVLQVADVEGLPAPSSDSNHNSPTTMDSSEKFGKALDTLFSVVDAQSVDATQFDALNALQTAKRSYDSESSWCGTINALQQAAADLKENEQLSLNGLDKLFAATEEMCKDRSNDEYLLTI